jgi:hypothetical protein
MNLLAVLSFAAILFLCIYGVLRVEDLSVKEGFALQPETVRTYQQFVSFFNPFMANWEKAITTAVGLERPAPTESSAQPPAIQRAELNQYISLLSQKLDAKLPPIRDPLPAELTPSFLVEFSELLSASYEYRQAIDWMNQKIRKSHAELEKTRAGEGFHVEGFAPSDQMCADVVECIEKNPQLLERLAKAANRQTEKKSASEQEVLIKQMSQILGNNGISSALSQNASLLAKSDQIQNQAKSGDLLPSFPKEESPAIVLPEGANKLDELKKNNPAQYKEYEKNNAQLVEMKSLFEQINRSLH